MAKNRQLDLYKVKKEASTEMQYSVFTGSNFTAGEISNYQQQPHVGCGKVSSSLWYAVCWGSTGASPPLWQTGGRRARPRWPPVLPPAWTPSWPPASLCYRSHPRCSEKEQQTSRRTRSWHNGHLGSAYFRARKLEANWLWRRYEAL